MVIWKDYVANKIHPYISIRITWKLFLLNHFSKIIVILLSLPKTRAKKCRKFDIPWPIYTHFIICYNPSANSRQSRSYAGWRPINRQKNTRKNASTLPRLFCLFARLVASRDYSHSIVPIGLGVKSISTLLIPGTSWVIR